MSFLPQGVREVEAVRSARRARDRFFLKSRGLYHIISICACDNPEKEVENAKKEYEKDEEACDEASKKKVDEKIEGEEA